MAPSKKKTPWEVAKPLLIEDIKNGVVTPEMKPKEVRGLTERPEYRLVPSSNFGQNLARLRKTINEGIKRADEDEIIIEEHRRLYPVDSSNPKFSYPRWDGSQAQQLLEDDIAAQKHMGSTPKELRRQATRTEYQKFPLPVLRGHIWQATKGRESNRYAAKCKSDKTSVPRVKIVIQSI